jgi:hypothetical protein
MPTPPDISQHVLDALGRYFRGRVIVVRPWSLGQTQLSAPLDPKRAITALREARNRMEAMDEEAGPAFNRFVEADGNLLSALRAEALIDAGFHIARVNDYGLPDAGREGVRLLREGQNAIIADSTRLLERYEEVARLRMGAALRLQRLKFVGDNLADGAPGGPGAVITRTIQLVEVLYLLAKAGGTFRALRDAFVVAHILLVNLKGNEQLPRLIRQIKLHLCQTRDRAQELIEQMETTWFPFAHEKGELSIGAYLCPLLPSDEDVEGLMREAGGIIDRFTQLYLRILGNLSSVSEQVEVITGVAPKKLRRK